MTNTNWHVRETGTDRLVLGSAGNAGRFSPIAFSPSIQYPEDRERFSDAFSAFAETLNRLQFPSENRLSEPQRDILRALMTRCAKKRGIRETATHFAAFTGAGRAIGTLPAHKFDAALDYLAVFLANGAATETPTDDFGT